MFIPKVQEKKLAMHALNCALYCSGSFFHLEFPSIRTFSYYLNFPYLLFTLENFLLHINSTALSVLFYQKNIAKSWCEKERINEKTSL